MNCTGPVAVVTHLWALITASKNVDTPVPDGSLLVQDVRARPPTSTSCCRSLPRLPLCLYLSPSLEVSHSRDVKAES